MRPQVWSQVGCCDFGWEGLAVLGDTVLASRGMALVAFLLASIAATKYQSAWLWLQLYLPCVRLVLQPTRMCLRIPSVTKVEKPDPLQPRGGNCLEIKRTSYVALVNLSILDFIFHCSLQAIFLLSTLSQFIQRPCLALDTA